MIKIPKEVLSIEELEKASGMNADRIDIEFTHVSIDKESLVMKIDTRLNFVMPLSFESKMKRRLSQSLGAKSQIDFHYMFIQSEAAIAQSEDANLNSQESNKYENNYRRKKQKVEDLAPGVLFGKSFKGNPITISEIDDYVGQKEQVILDGEVFAFDSRPIKNNKMLVIMAIVSGARTLGVKLFAENEIFEHLNENLNIGDQILVRGNIEFDTFDNENVLMAKAIMTSEKEVKEDTYPGGKRVELHIHTRMSDNDGFNDVEELVKTAASWNQPAVAITDHGVVQAFPDAANTAAKLEKNGKKIKIIYGVEGYLYPDDNAWDEDGEIDLKKNGTNHIILLAKNQKGLYNMYKLVSESHIKYFHKRARLPRRILNEYREGLIIGSACEVGEVYRAALEGVSDDELDKIASYYDYLEIQPLGNNQFLIDNGNVNGKDDLIKLNLRIVACADRLGIPIVATTDAHYPSKESAIYRNIIMAGNGFKDTDSNNLHMRTTDEMMEEFSYLGDRAEEIVIDNTNKIADMIEEVKPVPEGKYPPKIDGAEEILRKSCYDKAKEMYGDPIPDVIKDRIDAELGPIIREGYAVMYVAAKILVEKSLSDGYLVGSRGSVGSSFAATMAGITEVNPLEPHYICSECKYLEFTDKPKEYDTGFDMPDKVCPKCGAKLHKDGLRIPFATFLGFKGNKEPDIDLNFAGKYQPTIHKYVGEIFGEKNVFKAGTVSTVAEKTAFGYVKHYVEDKSIRASRHDIDYLVKGCAGVKRTTGQHPGGIIIVPDDHEIYEFCPIQKPANKKDVDVITTHFDYHKIDSNLLKLDLLGHDGPQMLRHIQDMTGVEPMSIPFDDKATLSIFTSLDELDIQNPDYHFKHGTYAIPEFGTHFTRQMLDDIRPTTVSALIKMSGFSHGTDVWTNNAQDLIRNKVATIDEVISSRDDIMNYLILKGVENESAFKIMETVRKNKPLTDEMLEIMYSHGVPEWYVTSCITLKYLFPRAHAAAYVMTSIRMAWFKVHYPQAFYAAFFTSKVADFDADCTKCNYDEVYNKLQVIKDLGNSATTKQKSSAIVYEVIYEMLSRGFEFSEPKLGISDATSFYVIDGKVNLPFASVSGIGEAAAISLVEAFNEKPFSSIDDISKRTKLSQTNIEDLKKHGLFEDLPDSAQVNIFDLFGAL